MLKVVHEEKQAIEADGFRESSESWADLLRDCKRRGMRAPVLAVGDGAIGFWKALPEVFPTTREQRCWFHVSGNMLAALPKSAHPGARAALAEIYNRHGPRAHPQGREGVRGALRREVAQSRSMSSIESAPATIPATRPGTFIWAWQPPGLSILTRSATSRCNPARSASCSTGASAAHDTRFGSSNTAVTS